MTKATRDQLVSDNIGLLLWHARQFAAKYGKQVEAGDYVTAGYLAMVEAAKRYRPDEGCSFEQFSRFRIYGAMMDQLRDEVGRTENTRRRKMHTSDRQPNRIGVIDSGFARVESEDWVNRAASLPVDERDGLVVRMKAAGFTHKEVGARLGCCETNVSHMIRKSIKPQLAAWVGG